MALLSLTGPHLVWQVDKHLIDMADLSAGEKQRLTPAIQSRSLNWILLTHFMLVDGWFCWPVL